MFLSSDRVISNSLLPTVPRVVWVALVMIGMISPLTLADEPKSSNAPLFVDLSLLVAPEYPCNWPTGFPYFHINQYRKIGKNSAYNSDILTIDGNTGTQLDVPPHSVARPELNLPHSGELGTHFTDKIEAWQFGGEACVVDIRSLLDQAPNGQSPLVRKKHIEDWQAKHRPLGFGDVVLLRSGYSDKYYQPFPLGRRFVADPVQGVTPGYPDPDPNCMEYIARLGVRNMGTDSPSMGPIPDLAEPTHYAGLKYGMIWTEGATSLKDVPATGAFYCMLGPKHAEGPYSEGRAFAVVGSPLANQLIESAKNKRAVDLSVTMSPDLPISLPGRGVGNHRYPYLKIDFLYAPNLDLFHHTHMFDSHAGTHLVPPSYALPPAGFDNRQYAPEIQRWLRDYESHYGPRGTSEVTTEQVPLDQTCGYARVIDVQSLVGSTNQESWPASPEITVQHIRDYEQNKGELQPGEIVIFFTGHTDRFFRPMPEGSACLEDPVNGVSEGWPAPGPDAIMYLAEKGIRCVATDTPTLGGVNPRRALSTYWAMGSRSMVGVEFLTNVSQLPERSYFLFAPVKIRDCHGGPGRAIALY